LKPAGAASCEADAWQTEESASASAVLHIADLTGLEFATGRTRLQLGAHAYPRENGITDLSPRSDLTGLADLNAGEHILCALTFTT
ncbi:MAG: hypothetical protein OXG13_19905, partial [Gemmatimonadaceae bacterium]|nr:hypothetical protein [Gemmatimonadaceae bacterium]